MFGFGRLAVLVHARPLSPRLRHFDFFCCSGARVSAVVGPKDSACGFSCLVALRPSSYRYPAGILLGCSSTMRLGTRSTTPLVTVFGRRPTARPWAKIVGFGGQGGRRRLSDGWELLPSIVIVMRWRFVLCSKLTLGMVGSRFAATKLYMVGGWVGEFCHYEVLLRRGCS